MNKLVEVVRVVAGKNAIGINNDDIARLSRTINYISTQLRMVINDIEDEVAKEYMTEQVDELMTYAARSYHE